MIEIRQTQEFRDWMDGLRDPEAKVRIAARLRRVSLGNPGDIRPVGGGVSELRIDYGAGYRLYMMSNGQSAALLLLGGDKSSQRRDIRRAKALARRK